VENEGVGGQDTNTLILIHIFAGGKKAVGFSSVQRLMWITAIAVALGIFVRPDGLGVFFGLAVFQVIIIANTAMPVIKERHNNE